MAGLCGSCTACCRVFAIPKMDKPAGKWCTHCSIGKGCKIYDTRPQTCIDFTCLWLESHYHDADMPIEARPDRCKVVFSATTKEKIIAGTTMPGMENAWRSGAAKKIIDKLINGGMRVVIGAPNSTTKIMIDRFGERTVEMTEPDENGIQWNKQNV